MKNSFKRISLFFSLSVSISCNNKSTNIDALFKSEKKIQHIVINLADEEILSNIYEIILIDSNLIAYDYNKEHFFSIININNNTLHTRFGKKGEGPNELLMMPTGLTILDDSMITIFSGNQNSLYQINYKENFTPRKKLEFNRNDNIFKVIPISSERYISMGAFEDGRYLLLDENGKKLSYNFEYPSPADGTDLSTPLFKHLAFQGKLMRKPDGGSFFFAGRSSEVFEIIEMSGNEKLNKIFDYHGEKAQFVKDGDGYNTASVAIKKESKMFFIDAGCTDNYIYLLYSKKVIGNNIYDAIKSNKVLVFDWEGSPATSLLLDIEVNYIAIDENDNYIYAYSNETEQLVKFKLQ